MEVVPRNEALREAFEVGRLLMRCGWLCIRGDRWRWRTAALKEMWRG